MYDFVFAKSYMSASSIFIISATAGPINHYSLDYQSANSKQKITEKN